ncbi:uncharacterized protein LOC116208579 [Punica granatum]|uniref:Uncharacterized protein n=2 Tax=Punica granatum TaxID=22663 RepID=A0A218XDU7_PUNGR|nr:uncharacterized protein LOC116208579 [Punica granatum]OWM82661.1 hypothetical protein CDL15_Pgr002236 [Punica granatum]PKI54188.1 hypothetical protein CRG98_025421 [Punica granatum]
MKASLKFRDDQKPLIRAKVPLNIIGLPFQSGIVAGESKELTLNLGTFFESGPSVRVSYRPNDSWNPFSLVVKTGTGPFGSPISSSMSMSAEFNLLNRGNPAFMLHFRPNFGDFSVKKSQSSVIKPKSISTEEDASIEVVEAPPPPQTNGSYVLDNGAFFGKKIAALTPGSPAVAFSGVLSGMEVAARTVVPVRSRAVVNFRWGVRVPGEAGNAFNPTGGITFDKVPFLVMNKIGIEHVPEGFNSKQEPKGQEKSSGKESNFPGDSDLAEACFSVKRQLEILQAENGMLRKAIEDLRREFSAKSASPSPPITHDSVRYHEIERNGNRAPSGKTDRRSSEKRSTDSSGFAGKSVEADVSEELKKALKGAGGA